MGDEKNQELLNYYSGRRVWRVLVKNEQGVLLGESMVTSSTLNAAP
jgi:hypothetical protein